MKLIRTLVVGGLALILPVTVLGQDRGVDLTTLTLDELLNIPIVTVTRTVESAANAPARVDVVTARQIQRRGYRSLVDVLKDLPGFKIDTAVDQDVSSDITVQGMRGSGRLVVLLDGIRISSPTGEALPILANYPVHNARQVEVLYGPASALYGADAFSGVINIISRSAEEAEGLRVRTSAGTGGLTNTETSFGARLGDRASLVVAGQYLYDRQPDLSRAYPEQFGGLTAQRTGVFNTIFGPMTAGEATSADYKVPVRAHSMQATVNAGALKFTFFESMLRTSNTPAYTPDNAVYNDIAYQQNELLVGAVTYTKQIGAVTHTSTVSGSQQEMDPTSGYMNVYSNMQRSYKYAFGSMFKAEHQATWRLNRQIALTGGGEHERYFSIPQTADLNAPVRSRAEGGTILNTTIPDTFFQLHYNNSGAFGQAQWTPMPAFALTVGARGDYNSRYGGTFNPRLGFVSHPFEKTTVKVMYGTAFLAPSPYQAYSRYGAFYSEDGGQTYTSPFWHVPNPDLKPQRKRTFEGQLRQVLVPNVTLTASGFRSHFGDLVLESDISSHLSGHYLGWPVDFIQTSVNGGHEDTWGGSFGVDALHSFGADRQLLMRADVSLANGHVNDSSAPAGLVESGGITPVLFHVSSDLDWNLWSVAPRLLVTGRQRALATETDKYGMWRRLTIPGYAVVDLTVRRERILSKLDGFLTVENALDARYRNVNLRAFTNPEEFVGSPQNPRRITVGVDVKLP